MITGDEKKWAETSNAELYKIAKTIWAKKFTIKQLRSFQAAYISYQQKLPDDSEHGVKFLCYQNMWQCATFAIVIKAFGE